MKKDTKVIYIEIDEELTSLIDRIKKASESHITIVVPKRASILQSVVNLKLIKNQAEKLSKEISLVTTDKTGRNLASQVGLTVYQSLSRDLGTDRADIQSSMHGNVMGDKEDKDVRKLSLADTLKKKNLYNIEPKKFWSAKEDKDTDYSVNSDNNTARSYTVVSPNKRLLMFLFGVSVLLLLVIGYYVLPNATIKVQPKIEKLSYTTNIQLVDADRYKNLISKGDKLKLIGSYPIEITELSHTKEYQATGERFTGSRASGKLKLINTANYGWSFIPTTRFQTADGIVFRLQDRVKIGPHETKDIFVVADEKDTGGKFVGARGNLPKGTKLILPALREESQKKVFAEVLDDITNGVSSSTKVLLKEDILAAKANIVDELFDIAETKLRERIEEDNAAHGQNLKLFESRDIESITKEVISVTAPEDLIGKDVETFEVTAKIRVKGIAYSQDEIMKIMSEGLSVKVLEDRVLVDIKDDEIEFHVVTNNPKEGKMKVEATIFGVTEYKVDARLGDKIRGKILGKSLEDASQIIKDMPEIGEVRIETWPFWVRKIPGVRSNIKIERLQD